MLGFLPSQFIQQNEHTNIFPLLLSYDTHLRPVQDTPVNIPSPLPQPLSLRLILVGDIIPAELSNREAPRRGIVASDHLSLNSVLSPPSCVPLDKLTSLASLYSCEMRKIKPVWGVICFCFLICFPEANIGKMVGMYGLSKLL